MKKEKKVTVPFTAYQKFVLFILAVTMFTVILDFMVMSPLGDILMKSMNISPGHFGIAVSAYAFSAGISGLLTAGFADKFDRKKLLLFFYSGFIAGTVLCGVASSFALLVAARVITGLFGGVIGSITMAIVADIFAFEQRGRVMGFVQMGFGASQVLGIPVGLYLANAWGWHAPFLWVAAMAALVALLIVVKVHPINAHLAVKREKSAFTHLLHTITKKEHRVGFTATALLSVGGFMMMPFGSAFAINNLHVTQHQLPLLFMITGISILLVMPLIGRLSDRFDKYKIFFVSGIWVIIMGIVYTNLGVTHFPLVVLLNVLLMGGVMGRMIPSSALVSAVPDMADRGAFMSINSSLQQIAGGIAAAIAGLIVVQSKSFGPLKNYDIIGYIMAAITLLSLWLVYRVSQVVKQKNTVHPKDIVPSKQDTMLIE